MYCALSGGCDTVFLDDPLSAVDAHVSKALFEGVLSHGGVLGQLGVTVVLAMNQLHFLPGVDRAVVMQQGRIVQQGSYAQLMQQPQGELALLMANYGFEQDKKAEEEEKEAEKEEQAAAEKKLAAAVAAPVAVAAAPVGVTKTVDPATAGDASGVSPPAKAKAGTKMMLAEGRVEGGVSWSVYLAYIRASGGWWVPLSIVGLFCVHQGGRVGADFWLAEWASQDWNYPKHTLAFWSAPTPRHATPCPAQQSTQTHTTTEPVSLATDCSPLFVFLLLVRVF